MLILLSPAKTLDFTLRGDEPQTTKPALLADAHRLAKRVKQLASAELIELMGISDNLAATVHGYFRNFKMSAIAKVAKPAALAFRGDVYRGLQADEFTANDWAFAQRHVRILSGLYGVLRPRDLIQPYRLEMGAQLATERGDDLYEYWGERIRKQLARDLRASGSPEIVNLASQEYFRAARVDELDAHVVTPSFRDLHNGKYKVLSFFAKRARGAMARWLVDQRVTQLKQITRFRGDGYRHSRNLSTTGAPVFTRDKS